jgi:hypothetical protein
MKFMAFSADFIDENQQIAQRPARLVFCLDGIEFRRAHWMTCHCPQRTPGLAVSFSGFVVSAQSYSRKSLKCRTPKHCGPSRFAEFSGRVLQKAPRPPGP